MHIPEVYAKSSDIQYEADTTPQLTDEPLMFAPGIYAHVNYASFSQVNQVLSSALTIAPPHVNVHPGHPPRRIETKLPLVSTPD